MGNLERDRGTPRCQPPLAQLVRADNLGGMPDASPTIVADYRNVCGEGPLWDSQRGVLFWTDIDSGKLYQLDVKSRGHRQIYAGDPVGGFTLQADGSLLLFRVKDISRLDPETGEVRKVRDFQDEGIPRFNDTQAAPSGACFAGTMGKTSTSGGLFLLSKRGELQLLHRGTGCSNGLCWSPDRKTMYWQCSTRKKIFAYDYDAATDAISNERVVYAATKPEEGTPDGMTIDSEGNLYSARWGGGGIYVHRPTGEVIRKIEVGPKQVTSCCFAGAELKDLYISTAARGDATQGAGALYHYRNPVAGIGQFRSRVEV